MIDQFEDIMGIVVETGCPSLDKKLNAHICYKGGGGTTVQESGIPKEFRPYIERGLVDAEKARSSGDLSYVAGLTPAQKEAQEMQMNLGRETLPGIAEASQAARGTLGEASRGEGIFGTQGYETVANDMSDRLRVLGDQARGQAQTTAALTGNLGSARQQAATEKAVMDTMFDEVSKELGAQRQGRTLAAQNVISSGADVGAQSGMGAAAIERVGTTKQAQAQREGDTEYQGLQRFFGLLGSPAVGQESKSTQSGGGK